MIGKVLDRYQILEEVGQGGMSVVYRGLDTSLGREVAVKVLHPHLAGHEEARRRFEREAQAVAKLRHENILEIFDYSGKSSTESYIVTEFIRGRTLKEFITSHKLAYPEIAAMVVTEVCRALAHAHALGVLHRDIKPENIMIRDDGCVKLTDFGIAQIVDAQRLTVTGQLLGSPAYMSPEHVEGRPLDFRTDVFSIGILLYQLATGELPFKGRNPHEILKRIAECKYLDARVVNPLVGERLGRIIDRGLAREPDDRYPDVAPMLDDLLRYLAEAEIGEPRAELARFFASPVSYEQALRQRLIAALTKRGKEELAARRVNSALELFNRVLTIDPANEEVLREIDRLSRRRRVARGAVLAGSLAAVVAVAAGVKTIWPTSHARPSVATALVPDAAPAVAPPGADAADAAPAVIVAAPADAAPIAVAPEPPDAGATATTRPRPPDKVRPALRPDAGATPAIVTPASRRRIAVVPTPKNAEYSLDGGPWTAFSKGKAVLDLDDRDHVVAVRNEACCFPQEVRIARDLSDGAELRVKLEYRPARVIPRCPGARRVIVDNVTADKTRVVVPNTPTDITEFVEGKATVRLTFEFDDGRPTQQRELTVRAGAKEQVIECTP